MAVERYSTKWRAAQRARLSFTCYYNTAEFGDVIVEKVYSESDVIHSMLWPSLVIVVCCAVFLRLETRRRRLTFCGRRSDAASLLLLPPTDAAQENSAQIQAFGEGNNHPPPAPPPTPLLLAQANSGQLLTGAAAATGHRSPCRRQASLPSNFAGNLECPMLNVPHMSEMAVDNHNTANVRRAIKSWSSSLTLRGCDVDGQSPSCNDHDNGLLPATVAIHVSSDDDSVNRDVANASYQ
jgi:hypothetical protein